MNNVEANEELRNNQKKLIDGQEYSSILEDNEDGTVLL